MLAWTLERAVVRASRQQQRPRTSLELNSSNCSQQRSQLPLNSPLDEAARVALQRQRNLQAAQLDHHLF